VPLADPHFQEASTSDRSVLSKRFSISRTSDREAAAASDAFTGEYIFFVCHHSGLGLSHPSTTPHSPSPLIWPTSTRASSMFSLKRFPGMNDQLPTPIFPPVVACK